MNAHPLTFAALVVLWVVTTAFLWRGRRWLVFYITGAFGFILLVVYGVSLAGYDNWLQSLEATQVRDIAAAIGLRLDVLGGSGLAIPNHTGWAVFDIGIECSALLEMSAIVGLAAFYPAFSGGRKAYTIAVGVGVTYVINLLRILLIVAIINALGTSWVFPAHAVFGRVFFFIGTITLYWYIITRPTISVVNRQLTPALAEVRDDE
ncbi:MAG: archaeosortase/exosortase family protein [Actinomycetota bacterium]|jgi:exosortase family protein XrtG|nr:archaeosortase/exosortase family protein [Actinomycetota bacterium]